MRPGRWSGTRHPGSRPRPTASALGRGDPLDAIALPEHDVVSEGAMNVQIYLMYIPGVQPGRLLHPLWAGQGGRASIRQNLDHWPQLQPQSGHCATRESSFCLFLKPGRVTSDDNLQGPDTLPLRRHRPGPCTAPGTSPTTMMTWPAEPWPCPQEAAPRCVGEAGRTAGPLFPDTRQGPTANRRGRVRRGGGSPPSPVIVTRSLFPETESGASLTQSPGRWGLGIPSP